MARSKQKQNHNTENIMKELMDEVSDLYVTSEGRSGVSIRSIADEFGVTPLKVRKLLITAGVFSSDICDYIHELKKSGKSLLEIQQITGLSRASVHSYLPYTKIVYNAQELSQNAERIKIFRERKAAIALLTERMEHPENRCRLEETLWQVIKVFEKYPLYTMSGLKFTYYIKGKEMFVNRKEKSITRSTIMLAFWKVIELEQHVKGPKQLKYFGASYLYSLFKRIKVIKEA